MIVLIWSDNRVLSDLVTRNLVRRGFEVREIPLSPGCAPGPPVLSPAADVGGEALAILDLDCQEPELWTRAARIRMTMPGVPLVILGHAWPAMAQLERLQPCTYVRKPFAIDELLAAVQELPVNLNTHP